MDPVTRADLFKIVRGVRNGMYYGGKVRLMHSIVMMILFGKGSLTDRVKRILSLTKEHALRIGTFVGVYKTIVILLKRLRGGGNPFHAFIAGGIGAYIINMDGESSINQQITFYVLARVIIGSFKILQDREVLPKFNVNRMLSLVGWGTVMAMFHFDKSTLPYSMQTSMNQLYEESEEVKDWTEVIPVPVPKSVKAALEKRFPSLVKVAERHQASKFKIVGLESAEFVRREQ